jgi:NAD-dependent deacetylase
VRGVLVRPAGRITDETVKQAAQIIDEAKHLVVFTGAGISVESGIPPFRGPGGLWTMVDPRLANRSYFLRHPAEVWSFWRERFFSGIVADAEPSLAHEIIARWEAGGLVKAVITQNVDSLHRKAGSREVFELHGSCRELRCEDCRAAFAVGTVDIERRIPLCPACKTGVLRPDLVMFEEQLPQEVWRRAEAHMDQADAVLVIGTSGEVFPAAELPQRAASRGARIIRIDPAEDVRPISRDSGRIEIHLRCGAAEGVSRIDAELPGGPSRRVGRQAG